MKQYVYLNTRGHCGADYSLFTTACCLVVVNMQHDALSEANELYECTCMDTQFMLNSGIVLFV